MSDLIWWTDRLSYFFNLIYLFIMLFYFICVKKKGRWSSTTFDTVVFILFCGSDRQADPQLIFSFSADCFTLIKQCWIWQNSRWNSSLLDTWLLSIEFFFYKIRDWQNIEGLYTLKFFLDKWLYQQYHVVTIRGKSPLDSV